LICDSFGSFGLPAATVLEDEGHDQELCGSLRMERDQWCA